MNPLILFALISASVGSAKTMDLEKSCRELISAKNYSAVIEKLNPNTDEISDRGFLLLATAYHETGDFKNLSRILNLLAEKRPKDHHVQFMLGDAQLKLSKQSKGITSKDQHERDAIASFRNALRLNRNYRPAHQALVNYFQGAGLNHEAREQLNEMLATFGDRGEIHADLCRLYSNDGFFQQAITHCRRAMMISPKFPESYIYLAQTYYDRKELALAESTLIKAAKKFPKSEFVQYGAGQFFLKKSNYPVAAKYLKRAVASEANSGRSQQALAKALFESGDVSGSFDHFKQACRLSAAAKSEFLAAASRLRLKGDRDLAGSFAMAASECKPQKN